MTRRDVPSTRQVAASPSHLKKAALAYARRGWKLIPIKQGTKAPHGALTPNGLSDATSDPKIIEAWFERVNLDAIAVAAQPSGLLVLDIDSLEGHGKDGYATLRKLEAKLGDLPATCTINTPTGGAHLYFVAPGVTLPGSLGEGIDVKNNGYVLLPPSLHPSGHPYVVDAGCADNVAELPQAWIAAFARGEKTKLSRVAIGTLATLPAHETLARTAASMASKGLPVEAIAIAVTSMADAFNSEPTRTRKIDKHEVSAIVTSAMGRFRSGDLSAELSAPEWDDTAPLPVLGADARYGLAGDILAALEEQTEAHPAAILFTLLAAVGNAAGPRVFASVGSEHHSARLSVLVVADTGTGKGQSLAIVRPILSGADVDWWDRAYCSGFNSGEGLIARLSGAHDGEGVAPETRALIIEPEFVRVLGVNTRDGSTLSAIARQAWDSGRLQITVKKESLRVDGAHVSLIGHITPSELRAKLIGSDLSNGFANRLLFVHAHRARKLPSGGNVGPATFACFAELVSEALQVGPRELRRTPDADELWNELYYAEPEPGGLLAAVTGRSAAQRLRLAVAYAILDKARELRPEHIRAAEAAWRYCYDSAHHIFGSALADAMESRILDALQDAWPDGVDGTGLRGLFAGHKSSAAINTACNALEKRGLILSEHVPTEGRSRIVRYASAKSSKSAASTVDRSLRALNTLNAHASSVVVSCQFPVGAAGEACKRCGLSWAAHAAEATGKPEGAA